MSCPKCNNEMTEHNTNVTIKVGKIRQKNARSLVCMQCGYVEFFLDNQ